MAGLTVDTSEIRGNPMRAVGMPRLRRMLASVAPLVLKIGLWARPSTNSQALMQD